MAISILINNQNLSVKIYNGQRVVTFKDIDTVHNRVEGTARRNFNANRKRFIEGVDYFKVKPNEIRTVGITSPNGGIVITESGYLLLVKSFTDDLSWIVQRELVKSYFREQQRNQEEADNNPFKKCPSEYEYVGKTFRGIPVVTIADICQFYHVNYSYLLSLIHQWLSCECDFDLLQGKSLKIYLDENPTAPKARYHLYIIYKNGFDKLLSRFNFDVEEIPKSMYRSSIQNGRKSFIVQEAVKNVMDYIRRDLKGIEALTYLVESVDTPDNLENYRNILVRKLMLLRRWEGDASLVKLGIHPVSEKERLEVRSGNSGLLY